MGGTNSSPAAEVDGCKDESRGENLSVHSEEEGRKGISRQIDHMRFTLYARGGHRYALR